MTSILLIGAEGQLGQELQKTLLPLGAVIRVSRDQMDLTQPGQIRQMIDDHQPQLIVNAAAYTAVDKAESEPELAHAVNGLAPAVMAEMAQKLGIALIHLSTDYVFNGQQATPYRETDLTNPVSVYGQSKLAGEQGIQQGCDRHIILRTAWVYGSYGKSNFVKTMLRLGASREEIKVVCDQVGSPTWAADLAGAISVFASRCLSNSEETSGQLDSPFWGIYNFTNSGVASWYDFAVAIFEIARQLELPLQVQRVLPIPTSEYPTPAKRPAYSVLSLSKTSAVLGYPPPHWQQSLKTMLVELNTYTYESSHSLRR